MGILNYIIILKWKEHFRSGKSKISISVSTNSNRSAIPRIQCYPNFSGYRYVWFLLPDMTVQIYSFMCLFLTSSNIAGFLRFCPAMKNICLVPIIKRMSRHRCSIPPHVYCCADKKRWYGYETISSVPCYIWTISQNYYIVFYFSKLAVFSCFLRPFYIIRNSQFFSYYRITL